MSGIELAERAVKVAIAIEHSPALIDEIAAMLGRAPLKRFELSAPALFKSHLSEEFARLVKGAGGQTGDAGNIAAKVRGIPPLREGFLPPGIHDTVWNDVVSRYGSDPNRSKMIPGMLHALHDLKESGVERTYLGGSFVSAAVKPNDFDITFLGAFKPTVPRAYARVLGDRDLMKKAYGGECLEDHLDFFMNSRKGTAIGVLKMDMDSLAPRIEPSPAYSVYDGWRAASGRKISLLDRLNTAVLKPGPFYTLGPR